jgi:hypothetical protein
MVYWSQAAPESFVSKSIGVHVLLDIVRRTVAGMPEKSDIGSTSAGGDKARGFPGHLQNGRQLPSVSMSSLIRWAIEKQIPIKGG